MWMHGIRVVAWMIGPSREDPSVIDVGVEQIGGPQQVQEHQDDHACPVESDPFLILKEPQEQSAGQDKQS